MKITRHLLRTLILCILALLLCAIPALAEKMTREVKITLISGHEPVRTYDGTSNCGYYEKDADGRNVYHPLLKSSDFQVEGVADGDTVVVSESYLYYRRFDGKDAGDRSVTLSLEGNLTVTSEQYNYVLSADSVKIVRGRIEPKTLTINPGSRDATTKEELPATKVYGTADKLTLPTLLNGLISGDTVTGKPGREAGEDVGTYRYTVGTLDAGKNYIIVVGDKLYEITPKPINAADVSVPESVKSSEPYTGSAITKSFTITYGTQTLQLNKDYTVSYANNIDVGTATLTITGMGNYSGSRSAVFSIIPTTRSITECTVTVATISSNNGSAQTPAVTVKDGTKTLVEGTDYTKAYANNTNTSTSSKTATVTITGKGNYTGTKTQTFNIPGKSSSGGSGGSSGSSSSSSGTSGSSGSTISNGDQVDIDADVFPDAVFRRFVEDNLDRNEDGALSQSEINAVTSMNVSGEGIASLKGIENFTALVSLDCSYNALTELDLSANTKLQSLYCMKNQLKWLDLRGNRQLTMLNCRNNALTSLNLAGNPKLEKLYCYGNGIDALNISNCDKLVDAMNEGIASSTATYRAFTLDDYAYLACDHATTLRIDGIEPDCVLPDSLKTIDEEAFEGASFGYVKLSERVTTIGSRAFANCRYLRDIYIPNATRSIAADAFENVPAGLTIHGRSGSVAEAYANSHGYGFVAVR